MSLHRRIWLTLAPILFLIAVVGAAGFGLIRNLGRLSQEILRENYDSVLAMERLNEATERIDSSFQFALAGREADARTLYQANWEAFDQQLVIERNNITIYPQEPELVRELEARREAYKAAGDRFYARPAGDSARPADYFADGGLLTQFRAVKDAAQAILRLNQEHMEQASRDARATADRSLVRFGAGLAVAAVIAAGLGVRLVRGILGPIAAVTEAALAVGAGQLHRTVPVFGRDELARLATAFNTMSEQVRQFRRSNLKQLLRAQRTAQAAIESFTDPVLVLDPEGRVELANGAARAVFGVAPAAGSDAGHAPWAPPDSIREPVLAALRDQRPYLTDRFDQAVSFRFGTEDRYFLPEVRPIRDPDGNTLGAAVVLDDVTRFRLLDRLKGDTVATVSHELKTPLTGVRLAVHVLLEEAVGPLTPKQAELLIDARDNCERLHAMIEQLLALARLEDRREALQVGPQPVGTLLQAAADAAAARAADKRVELVVGDATGLPSVAADPVRLGHALNNLVTNAVTYTEPGGTVILSAEAGDGRVSLVVADTGAGIDPEHLPHLFERFYRIPDDRRPPGTGLGLAIVREIALAHGGNVTCESVVDKGTTFRLTLPIAECGTQNAE